MADGRYEPEEPRPARFVWVWRGFFLIAAVAVAISAALLYNGAETFGIMWAVVAAGWAAIGVWLRGMHARMGQHGIDGLGPPDGGGRGGR